MLVLDQEVIEKVVVPKPTLADHYDLAASLIEEYGWQQCTLGDRQTGFCAVGALIAAAAGLPHCVLVRPFMEHTGYRGAWWNDSPGRTKEEVTAKLREIAKELRCSQS